MFSLPVKPGTPIFVGDSNIKHMKDDHAEDFAKYADLLEAILATPDFLAKHPKNDSVEYIKVFEPDHVLVAVRVSSAGVLYARTLFVMNDEKVKTYKEHGFMKPLV